MSSSARQPESSISRVALWPIWFGFRVIGIFLLLSFFALITSVITYRMEVPVEVNGVSQKISPSYLAGLNEWSLQHSTNPELSRKLSQATYFIYFKLTRIHHAALDQSSDGLFGKITSKFPNELSIAMLSSQLFGIRLGNVILMLPFIILVLGLATIDGLAERDIRRACYGHESAAKFQLARIIAYRLAPPVLGLIYLGLPFDISPDAVFVPSMIVLAILVRMKWAYLQKYF